MVRARTMKGIRGFVGSMGSAFLAASTYLLNPRYQNPSTMSSSSSQQVRDLLFGGRPFRLQANGTYQSNIPFSKTISRGPAVFYGSDRDGFGNYPSRKAIVDRARMFDGDNVGETFHNLYLGDTIWAAAISAEFSLRDPRKDTARPLVELLCRGIYDREPREGKDDVEERVMRYSAVCDNLLFNQIVEVNQKVGWLYGSFCDVILICFFFLFSGARR